VDLAAPLRGFATVDSPFPDPANVRERRLLRSLLEHALYLLDQEETDG
jgi:hypothetical protein